jgi:hypothetical protein
MVHTERAAPEADSGVLSLPSLTGIMPDESARPAMQDLTMLLFTVIFFALAFLYVKACQKLR